MPRTNSFFELGNLITRMYALCFSLSIFNTGLCWFTGFSSLAQKGLGYLHAVKRISNGLVTYSK